MQRRRAVWMPFLTAVCVLLSCGDDSPTSPTRGLDSAASAPATEPSRGDLALAPGSRGFDDHTEFTCESIEIVRARFGHPGWSRLNRVGLYVFFRGIPTEARTRIRIWWDYETHWGNYQTIHLPIGTDEFEDVVEHEYDDIVVPTEKLVRVALIVDGLTGHCARNRWVWVYPPGGGGGSGLMTANVGPPGSSIGTPQIGIFLPEGVRFTVSTTLTINSVVIEPTGPGTVQVNLHAFPSGTLLDSTSVAVSAGGSQRIPIGFGNIPPGTYILCLQGTSSSLQFPTGWLWGTDSATYPYTIPGVISLDDTALGAGSFFPFFYFYFYDWSVSW